MSINISGRFTAVWFILLCVAVASCRSNQKQSRELVVGTDTLAAILRCDCLVTDFLQIRNESANIVGYEASARFMDLSGHPATIEAVLLNDVKLPKHGSGYDTNVSMPLSASQWWRVSGNESAGISNLSDSLLVPRTFHLTYPAKGKDTVSRSKGFICKFDDPGTDSVKIMIYYDSAVTVMFLDSSIHNVRPAPIARMVKNTGFYTVEPEFLAGLPSSGVIQVWVVAENQKVVKSGVRKYLLASQCRSRTYCVIEP